MVTEEHDLPVEKARPWQIAADPAVDAEIDEGRERPDVFPVRSQSSRSWPAAKSAKEHVNGRVAHSPCNSGRQSHQRAAQQRRRSARRARPAAWRFQTTDRRQRKSALQKRIQTPRRNGNRHPQDQIDFLPERALFPKQQPLEFHRADQRAGHGSGHAQLDQQID